MSVVDPLRTHKVVYHVSQKTREPFYMASEINIYTVVLVASYHNNITVGCNIQRYWCYLPRNIWFILNNHVVLTTGGLPINGFASDVNQSFKHHKAGYSGDTKKSCILSFQWRHNERDGVSNHKRLNIVYSTVCSGADQRKHQSPASLALWGESTGERWIPLTRGQLRGKCFHLMTSSC